VKRKKDIPKTMTAQGITVQIGEPAGVWPSYPRRVTTTTGTLLGWFAHVTERKFKVVKPETKSGYGYDTEVICYWQFAVDVNGKTLSGTNEPIEEAVDKIVSEYVRFAH